MKIEDAVAELEKNPKDVRFSRLMTICETFFGKPRKSGGTLFERMASASRGGAKAEDEGDKDPLDIPRFLRSQNNQ